MGAPEVVACYQNRRQGSCEWLHFMIQDHHNAFDATPQSPGEGAFHDSASKFFLDVPLVVGLGTSNHGTLFTEYVGENGGNQCCQCKSFTFTEMLPIRPHFNHPTAANMLYKFSPRLKGTNPVACIHPCLTLLGHCMTPDGAHKMREARSP